MMAERYVYEYLVCLRLRQGGGWSARSRTREGAFALAFNGLDAIAEDCHGFREVEATMRKKVLEVSVAMLQRDTCSGYPPTRKECWKTVLFAPWNDPEMDPGFFAWGKERIRNEMAAQARTLGDFLAEDKEFPELFAVYAKVADDKVPLRKAFIKWWIKGHGDEEDWERIKRMGSHRKEDPND